MTTQQIVQMTPEQKTDSFVLSTITVLTNKYGIKADIDMETRQINFIGGTDQELRVRRAQRRMDQEQQDLARDIANILQRYAI